MHSGDGPREACSPLFDVGNHALVPWRQTVSQCPERCHLHREPAALEIYVEDRNDAVSGQRGGDPRLVLKLPAVPIGSVIHLERNAPAEVRVFGLLSASTPTPPH